MICYLRKFTFYCYHFTGGKFMYLNGLDELDQKIIQLLIENSRISYSDIGEKTGISRVAVRPGFRL